MFYLRQLVEMANIFCWIASILRQNTGILAKPILPQYGAIVQLFANTDTSHCFCFNSCKALSHNNHMDSGT